MANHKIITVQNVSVTVSAEEMDGYICITDIADAKSDQSRAADVIRNWLRNRSTLEYLSVWEQLYNPNLKVFESEHFKKQAGLLSNAHRLLGLLEGSCRYINNINNLFQNIFDDEID